MKNTNMNKLAKALKNEVVSFETIGDDVITIKNDVVELTITHENYHFIITGCDVDGLGEATPNNKYTNNCITVDGMTQEIKSILQNKGVATMQTIGMSNEKINRIINTGKKLGLTDRQINNSLKKEELIELEEKTQKPVKTMTITIEWNKSRTWGYVPNASAKIEYQDGSFGRVDGYKASGCGYDKASTVVANICNDTLKYLLWNTKEENRDNAPYGIYFRNEYSHQFAGGVGMSCYYNIMEYLGGTMEHVTSVKTCDVYRIEF